MCQLFVARSFSRKFEQSYLNLLFRKAVAVGSIFAWKLGGRIEKVKRTVVENKFAPRFGSHEDQRNRGKCTPVL